MDGARTDGAGGIDGLADGDGPVDAVLARCDYHPSRIAPEPDAVSALERAMSSG